MTQHSTHIHKTTQGDAAYVPPRLIRCKRGRQCDSYLAGGRNDGRRCLWNHDEEIGLNTVLSAEAWAKKEQKKE